MKHFMLPKSTTVHSSPQSNEAMASPSSSSSKRKKKQNRSKENVDPNSSPATVAKARCPLPPRPPSSNPLKRKLSMETAAENSAAGALDSGVKVIVRMRPINQDEVDEEAILERVSSDSLLINGQTFTFDAVADTDSTQVDVFELVGAPLVENCLAGFNSSIFAYGQTGSGKTYTMWGPAHALSEEKLSDQQGLTPRILRHLFARINEEQIKHVEKQLKYQCRCSFLEIYNEQITDLLDPNQGNLQIREDVKSGVYVENLMEETVCSMKDVNQLLLKGLSNRRTGATSINAESSRSHSVFTCIIESRCKSTADGISSFKTSRINLVDLAGSERQKLTGAGGERLKEAGNINRSLSQLGNLINILAEVSQTGKQRHIPYRDSKLTFLLQESLGGNAKLAMVCAVSPAQRCKSETFSTLRFAQRAKAIKNKAVVNEVMQEDVKFLREVIRQLKDELLRMKENGNNSSDGRQLTGQDVRRSLSILKLSLHHPMTLPSVDEDGDEEMEIDEQAIERLCDQVNLRCSSAEGRTVNKSELAIVAPGFQHPSENQSKAFGDGCSEDQGSEDTDVTMEDGISEQVNENDSVEPTAISLAKISDQQTEEESIQSDVAANDVDTLRKEGSDCEKSAAELSPPSINVSPCNTSPKLKSPTPSVSPRITNTSRKSLRTSSMLTASQKDLKGYSNSEAEVLHISSTKSVNEGSASLLSIENRKSSHAATELLAASIHRGLEKIDNHRRSLALRGSAFRFSYKPSDFEFILPVVKVDVGVQADPQENNSFEKVTFLCSNCKNSIDKETETESNEASNLQLVPVDGSESAERSKKQVPKAVEKVLAGSFRREMALEEYCAKQASEILQLNRLVQQYKHERECNAIIAQTREEKILRLESLMDGVLPSADFMEEEFASLHHEHKLLMGKYENHPEVLQAKVEVKRLQDQLEQYQNFFDMGEREVLLEEIQDLRSQLQYYIDASASSARKRNPLLLLKNSCEPKSDPALITIPESKEENTEEKFEQEKLRWMETESNWISLAEELRTELDTSRSLAQKLQQELDTEKKCAEDLKEAVQLVMQSNARMLEQYADLEEKHIQLLARHRNIQDGIDDVKKAAAKAGVKGAESKFIGALAAEISALKAEREKERRRMRDENRELQAQLRDTAEAVQAAGELLVRLKESEEAVAAAHKRAVEAEQESQKAYREIDRLKREHEKETSALKQILADSHLPKEAIRPYDDLNVAKYDSPEPQEAGDQQWREEFKVFYDGELGEPTSWFSGHDSCNI